MTPFSDRRDAGRQLAKRLIRYAGRNDVAVLGMSRAGIPVAYEVARSLRVPLEIVSHGHTGSHLADFANFDTYILVDDALESESRVAEAVPALRARGPQHVVVAAPVGSADVCARIRCLADECVVALAPFPFRGISAWYTDASDVDDDEIRRLCLDSNADAELALRGQELTAPTELR